MQMFVGLTDRWLAGNFLDGAEYLAAINQAAYLLWLIAMMFATLSIGATALVARFIGARDLALARRAAHQALLLGGILVVIVGILAIVAGPSLISLLRLEPNAAALAERYLLIVLPVLPAIMIEEVGIACLRGAGDTVSGLMANVALNVVNVVVGISLVIGWGPFPKLGWDGLAIGTAAGYVVSMLVVVWRLRRGPAGLRVRVKELKFNPDLAKRLLRIGLPGGADLLLLVLCQLWYVSIINGLGNVAAGAHGVGTSIEAAGFLTASAFQVAVATMTGQYLGAGDPRKAGRGVLWACVVGGGIVCANGFVLYFAAEPLSEFFARQQPDVAATVAPLLRIIASNQPFLGLAIILAGALRGAGDTRWPLIFTFIGFLLVRIPLAYLLALPGFTINGLDWHIVGYNLGIVGAWYAMWIDVFVRCILMCARFFHGGWKRVKV